MARDLVTVHTGTLDTTKSIAVAEITKTAIAVNNGATLVGITGVKDNSHALVVETTAATALTFKAGELQNNVQVFVRKMEILMLISVLVLLVIFT